MKNTRRFSTLIAAALFATASTASAAWAQSFGESQRLDNAQESRDIAVADIDGDGVPDMVWSGRGTVNLRWQRGEGGGFFGPSRELSFDGEFINSDTVSAADLDGDGDTDLMTTNFQNSPLGAVRIYENLGSGQFSSPQSVPSTPSSAMNGSLSDMDGDGAADLLFSSGNMRIYWCRNLGALNFGPAAIVVDANVVVHQVLPVDLEGDGDLDVLFRAQSVGAIFQVENLGGGTFGPRLLATGQIPRPRDLQAADFNGDGLVDLLSFGELGGEVHWCANLGGGAFAVPMNVAGAPGNSPVGIASGDVDGDGDIDAVISWRSASGLDWVENLGAGSFAPMADIDPRTRLGAQCDLIDVDGDGDLDSVINSDDPEDPGTFWAENHGAGVFSGLAPFAASTPNLTGFDMFDVDGDGHVDLVGADEEDGVVTVVSNPGNGLLRDRIDIGEGLFFPLSVRGADMDGDGDQDVVVAGGRAGPVYFADVSWLENLGAGAFTAPVTVLAKSADSGAKVRLHDFDGDGDTDVLAEYVPFFSFTGRAVVWIENDGNGGLTELTPRDLGPNARAVPIDIDGDQDLDIAAIIPAATGSILNSYETNGGTIGAAQPLLSIPSFDAQVVATDLDGDGMTDLLLLNGLAVNLLPGVPGPGFGVPTTLLTLPKPATRIALLDLDQDGDEDVVTYSHESATWFANQGGGLVGAGQAIAGWSAQFPDSRLGAADIDGDLDIDLYRDLGFGIALHEGQERFGRRYCIPAIPNSTGQSANLTAGGSPSVTANTFELFATDLPAGQFGFFVVADAPGFVVAAGGSQGNLCVSGNIGRIARHQGEIFMSSPGGTASVPLDLTDVPTATGSESVMAGDTRYFQGWFRDTSPTSTSNFTTGLRLTFTP